MRVIPIALQQDYEQTVLTISHAIRIVRADDEIFRYTDHDRRDEVDGEVYDHQQGFSASGIVTSSDLAVGSLELNTLHDGSLFTSIDLLEKRWDNAKFLIFRYNWSDPSKGVDRALGGMFGEVRVKLNMVVAELRDLRQYFEHGVGDVSSEGCPYRIGDERCRYPIESLRVTGSVTSVVNRQSFIDSTRTEADDYYGWGQFTWLSGNSAGITRPIKLYDGPNKKFTLMLPMYSDVQFGDEYSVIPGCRGRHLADCRDKYNWVLNFGGQPHRPTLDQLTQTPEVSV